MENIDTWEKLSFWKVKLRGLNKISCGLLLLSGLGMPSIAVPGINELPTGINVTHGNATVTQSGNDLNINATTNSTVIHYDSFSVGSNAAVNFTLNNASSVLLNKVTGNNISEIWGQMNANTGHVFLVNPNGIHFGPSASVNVPSLIASTHNIVDSDFINSNYRFSEGYGMITNEGSIDGNYIGLLSSAISNSGSLNATAGIDMAIGDIMQVSLLPGITATVNIDQGLSNAVNGVVSGIENTGSINGDQVRIQGELDSILYNSLINLEGMITASSLDILASSLGGVATDVDIAGVVQADQMNVAVGSGALTYDGIVNVSGSMKSEVLKNPSSIVQSANSIITANNIEMLTNNTSGGDITIAGDISATDNVSFGSGDDFLQTSTSNISSLNGEVEVRANGVTALAGDIVGPEVYVTSASITQADTGNIQASVITEFKSLKGGINVDGTIHSGIITRLLALGSKDNIFQGSNSYITGGGLETVSKRSTVFNGYVFANTVRLSAGDTISQPKGTIQGVDLLIKSKALVTLLDTDFSNVIVEGAATGSFLQDQDGFFATTDNSGNGFQFLDFVSSLDSDNFICEGYLCAESIPVVSTIDEVGINFHKNIKEVNTHELPLRTITIDYVDGVKGLELGESIIIDPLKNDFLHGKDKNLELVSFTQGEYGSIKRTNSDINKLVYKPNLDKLLLAGKQEIVKYSSKDSYGNLYEGQIVIDL